MATLASPLISFEREYTDVLVISRMRLRKKKEEKSSVGFFFFFSFNWVRCKPVGPRPGKGAAAQESLVLPRLGPVSGEGTLESLGNWDPIRLWYWVPSL